jgi:hypothetical protein
MPTTATVRSETRTRTIAAPPSAVLDVLGDARNLPRWAPAFARSVRQSGDHWVVDSGAGELVVDLRVAREQGTVDLTSSTDRRRGAFLRVLPNADGSECLFTLFFGDGTPDEAVAAQMATVEDELARIASLAEA